MQIVQNINKADGQLNLLMLRARSVICIVSPHLRSLIESELVLGLVVKKEPLMEYTTKIDVA